MPAASRELVELHGQFLAFLEGREKWSRLDGREFAKRLAGAAARCAFQELGIDPSVFDVAAALQQPDTNLCLFPSRAELRLRKDGDAK